MGYFYCTKKILAVLARCQWLTPVILATWEAVIRRIALPGQSGEIVHEIPFSKITEQNGLQV
jgi:hypothetical protein